MIIYPFENRITSVVAQKNVPAPDALTAFLKENVLLDHISDAVIFTDMEYQVVYFNKKAEQLYGIYSSDIIGCRLGDIISYEYINDTREKALQQLKETGNWQGKVVYTRQDQQQVYFLATVIYALNAVGEHIGMVATLKDITRECHLEDERLKNKVKQQKEINRVMIKIQENERNQLGRELHDNINQILAVIKLQLEFALENYEDEKPTVESCKTNIDNVITEIRHLSHRLVLPRFAESSLQGELEKMIHMICQQQKVILDINHLNENDIPDNIKETLYRIIQEQLNNIIKHAKAGEAIIRLHNDGSLVFLHIEDNGQGFNMTQSRNGVGITNILNRVESYNGSARIISQPGQGCHLMVTIPLKEQE